jgi:hypothetical protein
MRRSLPHEVAPLHTATCTPLPVAARTVHRTMHDADGQQVHGLMRTDRDQALLNSLSSHPESKWIDTFPIVPSLRLDEQSSQDKERIWLGVRNLSTR